MLEEDHLLVGVNVGSTQQQASEVLWFETFDTFPLLLIFLVDEIFEMLKLIQPVCPRNDGVQTQFCMIRTV